MPHSQSILYRYVEILKAEKPLESTVSRREGTQTTRSELERTVLTLKRLVEKLQQENKKLRAASAQLDLEPRCECAYLREEHELTKQRVRFLERELELAGQRIALMGEAAAEKLDEDGQAEVAMLRQQLSKKSELLLKVKDLLAKASDNEKALRQRVSLPTIFGICCLFN